MAKGKKADKADKDGPTPLEILDAEITREYGKGILATISSVMEEEQEVISAGPVLDAVLSGGVPKGSWLSVSGPPKTGKTTTLLTIAAAYQAHQKALGRRGLVIYHNVERRAKPKNYGGIHGLDRSDDWFRAVESTPEKILSAEEHLTIAIKSLNTVPECFLIFDSLSALVESDVLEGGLSTETRGGGAKLVTKFVNIVSSVVPVQKSIVCGVTHRMADTSGRTQGQIEKAANRWIYQADIRLWLKWSESWCVGGKKNKDGKMEGGREIGKKMHWQCLESAIGAPGMSGLGYLRYGVGIDKEFELLEMAKATPGLMALSGAWYEFSFLAGRPDLHQGPPPKALGGHKAAAMLRENPAWAAALQKAVLDFLRGPQEDVE